MHDPLVVAFEIRRPWPKRSRRPGKDGQEPLFRWERHGPWWKPGSWSVFVVLARRWWYFPALITIWHREPNGHDSGEVCKHYRREQDADGKWQTTFLNGWRFHLTHWKIQVPPLQMLRRRLLTRCAWCGGPSRKGDPVDVSHQWDGPRGRWWRGEPGLFHHDCSAIKTAHESCVCEAPILEHDTYGQCLKCEKTRSYGLTDEHMARRRTLAAIPLGGRLPSRT